MKVIEIPANEFEELTKELEKCRKDKEKLEKANKYLNAQIREYNEKFAKDENEN